MSKVISPLTYKDISIIMPSYNTLNYTLMAYRSLRQYYPDNEIIILDDGSTDGTEDWLLGCEKENGGRLQGQVDLDDNLRGWRNTTGTILGHTITYDMGIKMAKNKLVTIFHSDMIAGKNYLENLIKHWAPKRVVCATRIEPEGIYPPGKEKILKPFGIEFHEFKREEFEKFVEEEQRLSIGKTTNGIFAPWLISKDDFLAIGGHDAKHFAPYPEEDADLFLRFALAGYTMLQSRDSLCWHWISRGHRSWAKNGVGKDDNMFQFYQNRARRNYLRKWHKWMQYDENRHPITHPVYDIGIIIQRATDINLLHFVEPWANCVYVTNENLVKEYIAKEQPTTKIDLSQRVKVIGNPGFEIIHQVLLEFDQSEFLMYANENAAVISKLTDIIAGGVEDDSEFEYVIFKLRTKKIKDLAPTLIKV
jgi:GT2 family glycosyltransferase